MTAIVTPSYHKLVASMIIETLGPNGLNVLAWIEVPRGRGKELIGAVFSDSPNTYTPITNGIICRLPDEELFKSIKTSPYESRRTTSMDIVFNLYLKEDIEIGIFESSRQVLEDNGQEMPEPIRFMTDAYDAVVTALQDLKRDGVSIVMEIDPLYAHDRSNANGVMPAQRSCRIKFVPQNLVR
jgi:hypothetical protein